MKEKMIKKLQPYGLTLNDLTSEEVELLKKEIAEEQEGKIIIDGVLSNKPLYKK